MNLRMVCLRLELMLVVLKKREKIGSRIHEKVLYPLTKVEGSSKSTLKKKKLCFKHTKAVHGSLVEIGAISFDGIHSLLRHTG